jgi:hypothetical protein
MCRRFDPAPVHFFSSSPGSPPLEAPGSVGGLCPIRAARPRPQRGPVNSQDVKALNVGPPQQESHQFPSGRHTATTALRRAPSLFAQGSFQCSPVSVHDPSEAALAGAPFGPQFANGFLV